MASSLTSNRHKNKMPSYPGLGLPLWYHPQRFGEFYATGHHESCCGSKSDLLQVREVAMMHVMDRLTDKADWHKKVFDEKIVAKLRAEALAYPDVVLWNLAVNSAGFSDPEPITGIMTEKAFDYCIQELQGKARYFADTGIVPTLDARLVVAKSDSLIQPELANALRKAFGRLKKDQGDSPDWHPGSDDKVLNLVHPSMYPLVYGSTKRFQDEVVGVADAVEKWAGKGTVISNEAENQAIHPGWSHVPLNFWSDDYQWLPSNVTLHDDGSVKFTSYINNLHPTKYPEIYGVIEKLVEKALPMWDQCLGVVTNYTERESAGRSTSRLSLPSNPSDENEENWIPPSWESLRTVRPNKKQDNHPSEDGEDEEDISSEDTYDDESEEERLLEEWQEIRQPVLREPEPFEEVDYTPPHRLSQRFKDTGLQVIVKMVSIELTPEKPSYAAGSWHVEGQMNEHICATALYYLDSENITTNDLSFRMQTDSDLREHDDFQVGQNQFNWLERVHGTELGYDGNCQQSYGSVETPQGRLLAFPNVFQHRVSPFQLVDPTKPGHRRFIALWLVDPHIRIISTANVPPQQQDWWVESVLGRSAESQQASLAKLPVEIVQLLGEKGLIGKSQLSYTATGKLPIELLDMVRTYFDESPAMSDEDARDHRLKLMDERTSFNWAANRSWDAQRYNFCEH